jgi:hypothetical protein
MSQIALPPLPQFRFGMGQAGGESFFIQANEMLMHQPVKIQAKAGQPFRFLHRLRLHRRPFQSAQIAQLKSARTGGVIKQAGLAELEIFKKSHGKPPMLSRKNTSNYRQGVRSKEYVSYANTLFHK